MRTELILPKLAIDLTGMRFGKLLVISYEGQDKRARGSVWKCRCDCGEFKTVPARNLKGKKNRTRSCGCIHKNKSHEWRNKIRDKLKGTHLTLETRIKISLANKGEKCRHWKGGEATARRRTRHSFEVREWRNSVFKRDDYTCQECGDKGVSLNAHHKETWAGNRELRFDINNGITLCVECHKRIHTMRKGRPSTIKTYLKEAEKDIARARLS